MRGESIWYLTQREQCGPGFREEATGVSFYFLQWWEVGKSRQSFSCNWLHAGLEDPGVYPGDEKTVRGLRLCISFSCITSVHHFCAYE